jgi:hypothetical protein
MYPFFHRVVKPVNNIMMPAPIAPPISVNAEPLSVQAQRSCQLYKPTHPGMWRMNMAQPNAAASLLFEPTPFWAGAAKIAVAAALF